MKQLIDRANKDLAPKPVDIAKETLLNDAMADILTGQYQVDPTPDEQLVETNDKTISQPVMQDYMQWLASPTPTDDTEFEAVVDILMQSLREDAAGAQSLAVSTDYVEFNVGWRLQVFFSQAGSILAAMEEEDMLATAVRAIDQWKNTLPAEGREHLFLQLIQRLSPQQASGGEQARQAISHLGDEEEF